MIRTIKITLALSACIIVATTMSGCATFWALYGIADSPRVVKEKREKTAQQQFEKNLDQYVNQPSQ